MLAICISIENVGFLLPNSEHTHRGPASGSYRVLGPLVVILLRFAELVFEGAGQLVEQAHLLAVLEEAGGRRSLVWWRRRVDGRKRQEQMTIQ